MITQETINKINKVVQQKDIEVTEVDQDTNTVCFTLPYSSAESSLTLVSQGTEEQFAEFCEGVNAELEGMINHLNECKLDVLIPDYED